MNISQILSTLAGKGILNINTQPAKDILLRVKVGCMKVNYSELSYFHTKLFFVNYFGLTGNGFSRPRV